jgi:hypothetical protein
MRIYGKLAKIINPKLESDVPYYSYSILFEKMDRGIPMLDELNLEVAVPNASAIGVGEPC